MAERKTRSDCRVGTFEKKKGIPLAAFDTPTAGMFAAT